MAAHVSGAGALARQLKRIGAALEATALDAAAEALAEELAQARRQAALDAPLVRARRPGRRTIGAPDTESATREFGTPSEPPAPWLAPVLPAARGPMRAAVRNAAARALSRLRRRT